MELNAKQKKFCEILVSRSMSASAAYSAVYKTKNRQSAQASASKLLTNPIVSDYISHLQERATDDTIMTRREVLQELSRLGRANMAQLTEWDNTGVRLKDSKELSKDHLATVSEIQETITESGGTIKIKQYDKVKSLELLAKHHGALDGSRGSGDNGDGESSISKILGTIRKIRK